MIEVISLGLGLIGIIVGAWFSWRGQKAIADAQKASAQAASAEAYAKQVEVAVNALTETVDTLRTELTATNETVTNLRVENGELRGAVSTQTAYEALLVNHINAGKGPPPPPRPRTQAA